MQFRAAQKKGIEEELRVALSSLQPLEDFAGTKAKELGREPVAGKTLSLSQIVDLAHRATKELGELRGVDQALHVLRVSVLFHVAKCNEAWGGGEVRSRTDSSPRSRVRCTHRIACLLLHSRNPHGQMYLRRPPVSCAANGCRTVQVSRGIPLSRQAIRGWVPQSVGAGCRDDDPSLLSGRIPTQHTATTNPYPNHRTLRYTSCERTLPCGEV